LALATRRSCGGDGGPRLVEAAPAVHQCTRLTLSVSLDKIHRQSAIIDPEMKKVLIVCTGNKDRSPTAAMLLAEMCAPMWITSAGTEPWARNQVDADLLEESDVICVMEEAHRRFIIERFGDSHERKILVLDVPDNYICWEAELVHILKPKLRAALGLADSRG
jgi:predicted protein tyrosine phosphatase